LEHIISNVQLKSLLVKMFQIATCLLIFVLFVDFSSLITPLLFVHKIHVKLIEEYKILINNFFASNLCLETLLLTDMGYTSSVRAYFWSKSCPLQWTTVTLSLVSDSKIDISRNKRKLSK